MKTKSTFIDNQRKFIRYSKVLLYCKLMLLYCKLLYCNVMLHASDVVLRDFQTNSFKRNAITYNTFVLHKLYRLSWIVFIRFKRLNIKIYHEAQIMNNTFKIFNSKSVSDKDNACFATFQPRIYLTNREWVKENNLKPRILDGVEKYT